MDGYYPPKKECCCCSVHGVRQLKKFEEGFPLIVAGLDEEVPFAPAETELEDVEHGTECTYFYHYIMVMTYHEIEPPRNSTLIASISPRCSTIVEGEEDLEDMMSKMIQMEYR